jgi:hypothetical protein
VKATRDFKVHEYVKLYGSAADLTDDQDDEMRMDTSQLKADVSVRARSLTVCIAQAKVSLDFTVQRAVQSNEELLPDLHGSRSLRERERLGHELCS